MLNGSSQYATLLRRELCARNASYAALHQLPHVTNYGEMPVVVYQLFPCGTQHGNFIRASYRAIQRRPQWKRRFEKVQSRDGTLFAVRGCRKELDSVPELNPGSTLPYEAEETKRKLDCFSNFAGLAIEPVNSACLANKPHSMSIRRCIKALCLCGQFRRFKARKFLKRLAVPHGNVAFRDRE
jgi:hypothetical protein